MRHTYKQREGGSQEVRGPSGRGRRAALPVPAFGRRAGRTQRALPLLPHLLDAVWQELEVGGAIAADDPAGADCQLGEGVAKQSSLHPRRRRRLAPGGGGSTRCRYHAAQPVYWASFRSAFSTVTSRAPTLLSRRPRVSAPGVAAATAGCPAGWPGCRVPLRSQRTGERATGARTWWGSAGQSEMAPAPAYAENQKR
jgi:hypothetical protein